MAQPDCIIAMPCGIRPLACLCYQSHSVNIVSPAIAAITNSSLMYVTSYLSHLSPLCPLLRFYQVWKKCSDLMKSKKCQRISNVRLSTSWSQMCPNCIGSKLKTTLVNEAISITDNAYTTHLTSNLNCSHQRPNEHIGPQSPLFITGHWLCLITSQGGTKK